MSERTRYLQRLRQQAEAALLRGEISLAEAAPELGQDLTRLFEELRIYQAELEVQNSELQHEQATSEHERTRFESLFKSLPMAALVIDNKGVIDKANPRALALFGFHNHGALQGHSIYRLLDDDNRKRLARLILSGTWHRPSTEPPLLTLTTAGGRRYHLEAHLGALPHHYHLDRHAVLILADRTTEHVLTGEKDILQALLDNADALMYAFDREGRCLLANRAMLRLLERNAQEVIGKRRSDWQDDADARHQEDRDSMVLLTGDSLICQENYHVSGSSNSYYLTHKFPLRNRDGEIFAVGGITTDITASHEKELRLTLAMEVFSKGREGIMITNGDNRIISVNRAFERITGYREDEVLGENPRILASGRHDKAFYQTLWHTIMQHGFWEGEIWNRRKSGEVYPQWLHASRVGEPADDTLHFIAVFSDITQRKANEEKIERLAFYDTVTDLPNRYLLHDRVKQAISMAQRKQASFALVFLDLDHFKDINDTHGHEVGDSILREAAARIRDDIRAGDTLCRLGGDEFVLLLTDIEADGLNTRLQRLTTLLHQPFSPPTSPGQHVIQLTASLGVAMFPDDGADYQTLLKHADIAMYQAKRDGRNRFCFFNPRMAERLRERMELETALQNAILKQQFQLAYQPQIRLADGRICGVEALLRWNHPEMGRVSPGRFIPVAEQSDLILDIGDWVLDTAMAQLRTWRQQGHEHLVMAVNVAARQFWSSGFVERLAHKLHSLDLPPERLELEITERTVMAQCERGLELMRELKRLGVRLSIDDFGTGYSSLAYLRWMQVHTIKIDQSFVHDIGRDEDDEAICRTIIDLAHSLGIETMAEGVETPIHAEFLRRHGCEYAQGYHYAHPMWSAALTDVLQEGLNELPAHSPS